MISSVNSNAILGLQRSQDNLLNVSKEIASYPAEGAEKDLNSSLVALKENEQIAKANVESIKAADGTMGTLLDVLA